MPFIVQCPHADCRKYMLLEDSSRGAAQECLLCKKPIQIDAVPPVAPPAKPARWSGNPSPSHGKSGRGGKG